MSKARRARIRAALAQMPEIDDTHFSPELRAQLAKTQASVDALGKALDAEEAEELR